MLPVIVGIICSAIGFTIGFYCGARTMAAESDVHRRRGDGRSDLLCRPLQSLDLFFVRQVRSAV
jgi:hypothetical protein